MGGQKKISKVERLDTVAEAAYRKDYKEIPVQIGTFLSHPTYLGNITERGNSVFPFWRRVLSDIAIDDTRYLQVFTGAIGCLGSEVKVSLLDGRELTIPEIIEERKQDKKHWVYSYDVSRGKVVPGEVTDAMLSGKSVGNIVEIELDNKEKILCTHDHPFLTTEGIYKKAEELEFGDSLLPLYREESSDGYELMGAGKQQWRPTFRIVAEEIYGNIPKGSCVHHHPEGGKKDNSPENLEVMLIEEHMKLHSVELNPFRNIPGFASLCAKKRAEKYWNGVDGAQHREEASRQIKKRNKEGQAKKAGESRWSKNVEEQKEKLRKVLIERNEKGQAKKAGQIRWSKSGAAEHHSKSMKKWWATHKKPREVRVCAFSECSNTFECRVDSGRRCCSPTCGNKSRRKRNHKVVRVTQYSKRIDVYDLSVDKYHNFALTSGVFVHNTGKTCSAIAAICYGMYRVLCLKDPWKYFEKIGGGKIAIVFFNLTKSISHGKGFNLLQSYLLSSPWFRARGVVVEGPSIKNPRIDFPIFDYISGSPYAKGFGFVGQDVLFAIMDEVDDETESIKQKMRVLQAYETTIARFESRFVRIGDVSRKGETLGRFFLCASKQEKMSFLNTFIVKMKNSPIINTVDAPLWEVRTDLNFSGVKFPLMLGDLYSPSKILGDLRRAGDVSSGFEIDKVEMALSEKQGFEIIWIPIEFLERFQKDIVGNLRRLAGISVNQLRKSKLFPSEKLLIDCYDPVKKDPVSMLTIWCGLEDDLDLCQYIDFDKIRIPRHVPRYLHVDIAYAGGGDALGIGMSCISGWSDRTVEDLLEGGEMRIEKLPIVETDFGMRIKARLNDKIPLAKIRKFIGDLKIRYGFNIKLVTYDYDALSEESKQILTRFGIECASQSLDKSPYKYRSFRNLCGEKRWCCHRNEYLHFELVNLEDDTTKNKVDHPDEVVDVEILDDGSTEQVVLKGSKDMCFTKDVKVSLLDGRSLSIPEIEYELSLGKELYTYSVDFNDKKIVAGKIVAAFQSGKVDRLVEITLDNGEKITCTLDHPFITKAGEYVTAKELLQGDSLLPLYTKEWKGYRLVKNPFFENYNFEHRLFSGFLEAHLCCNEYLVHHKWDEERGTFNKSNNSPNMLQIMTRSEHAKLHALYTSPEKMLKMQKRAWEVMATSEWKAKQAEVMRRAVRTRVKRGHNNSWMKKLRENGINPMDDTRVKENQERATAARRGSGRSWCSGLTKETDKRVMKLGKKGSKTIKNKNKILRQKKVQCFVCSICSKVFENTNACFVKNHIIACKRDSRLLSKVTCKYCKKSFTNIYYGKFASHRGNCANKAKKLVNVNHKVVNVKFLSNEIAKVYDLTIEKYHNFALSAGVFVHNSDGVVGSVMSALEDSGAPAPREFIDLVKEIISQPKIADLGHSLIQIDRTQLKKPKESDVLLRGTNHTKFKDIFNKAQGRSGK